MKCYTLYDLPIPSREAEHTCPDRIGRACKLKSLIVYELESKLRSLFSYGRKLFNSSSVSTVKVFPTENKSDIC